MWLVVFLSSGARHLAHPTAAGSETAAPHGTTWAFATLTPFSAHPAAPLPVPLRARCPAEVAQCGAVSHTRWHRCSPGTLPLVSHCHCSSSAEDRGSNYSSYCPKIHGKRSRSIWLQGNKTRNCSRIKSSDSAIGCSDSFPEILNKRMSERERRAQSFTSGSRLIRAGLNTAPAQRRAAASLFKYPGE